MNRFRNYVLMLVLLVSICGIVQAEVRMIAAPANSEKEKEPSDGFIELTISPAAEPVPALQYRLLPLIEEQKPGNAAIDWFKLASMMPTYDDIRKSRNLAEDDPDEDKLRNMPFAQFKSEYLEYADKYYKISTWDFLRHAALRESCDWQDPFEDGLNMLMPNLSDLKRVAKNIALEARVEVAKGNYEQALNLLSYNFALAQDVSEGKTIIQNLVGIGVAALGFDVINDMVAQPDCPNLYWALEMMPDSLVSMRRACEAEMSLWINGYVKDLDTTILSVEQANKRFNELFNVSTMAMKNNDPAYAAIIAMNYTLAKKHLLEIGYDQKRVELMPTAQVVLLSMWKKYVPVRDDYFKYLSLPYYQGHELLAKQEKKLNDIKSGLSNQFNLFYVTLPGVARTIFMEARLQVKADALICVEAIRMYAAVKGKLPEKLSDIDFAPTPINAFTGKEFKYYLDGDIAVLDVEEPEENDNFRGYKISLRR